MVVQSEPALDQFIRTCKPSTQFFTGMPTIDLTHPDANSHLVKACEEFGFFKVVNHGIPLQMMSKLEEEVVDFFKLPQVVKEKAGNPRPFGYGNKRIGQNGDVGWVEYLLLSASPDFIHQICLSIFPDNPHVFRSFTLSSHSLLSFRIFYLQAQTCTLLSNALYQVGVKTLHIYLLSTVS